MSSSVIVDGVIGLGMSLLEDRHRAFVNFSEEMLLDGTVELLDPSRVVVEILEDVEPTPSIVEAVRRLSELGFTIVLDDFVYDERFHPLLELADIVKVDVGQSADVLDELVERLRTYEVRLLAEKVEDQAMHDRCVALRFDLFQGYHYFRPETVRRREISAQSAAIIRLMNLVQDINATDSAIEDQFRSDPSLAYKLLRIVNAAARGGRGVDSIGHALRLLGRDRLFRWLGLLLMVAGAGDDEMAWEVVRSALLRARMCEQIGTILRSGRSDVPSSGSLFLIGLFSQADQILGGTLPEILAEVDVARDVRDALLSGLGVGGAVLHAAEKYGRGDWDGAHAHLTSVGASRDDVLPSVYEDAASWARSRLPPAPRRG